jgi:hypothetical protein
MSEAGRERFTCFTSSASLHAPSSTEQFFDAAVVLSDNLSSTCICFSDDQLQRQAWGVVRLAHHILDVTRCHHRILQCAFKNAILQAIVTPPQCGESHVWTAIIYMPSVEHDSGWRQLCVRAQPCMQGSETLLACFAFCAAYFYKQL